MGNKDYRHLCRNANHPDIEELVNNAVEQRSNAKFTLCEFLQSSNIYLEPQQYHDAMEHYCTYNEIPEDEIRQWVLESKERSAQKVKKVRDLLREHGKGFVGQKTFVKLLKTDDSELNDVIRKLPATDRGTPYQTPSFLKPPKGCPCTLYVPNKGVARRLNFDEASEPKDIQWKDDSDRLKKVEERDHPYRRYK